MPSPEVLLPIAGLALLDTLSPTTIGISLFVLLSGAHSIARPLFAYLGTVAAFYFVLGCGLMLGLGALFDSLNGLADNPVAAGGMVIAGAALILYSFRMDTGPRQQRRPASFRTGAMIGLGLATGLLEAGTALPYLGAIGIMTAAELSAIAWAPLLAAYNAMMVLPPVLLYTGYRAFGERLRPRLARWRTRIDQGSRTTLAWVIGIAGFLVLANGLTRTELPAFIDGLPL